MMGDTSQYDAIAGQYKRTRESPVRRYIESWTLWQMLGEVDGLDVLDLGCGEGFYARQLKQAGARQVTGVDASAAMIGLAREQEAAAPLGIEYHCHEVQQMPDLGHFDLVLGAYLLHYAHDPADLEHMCRRIAAQLKPGGRLVAINENPEQTAGECRGYAAYGFSKQPAEPRSEGAPIIYRMIAGRELISFQVRWFSRACYESALTAAGFADLRWRALALDPAGLAEYPPTFWQEYLKNPPVVGLEGRVCS